MPRTIPNQPCVHPGCAEIAPGFDSYCKGHRAQVSKRNSRGERKSRGGQICSCRNPSCNGLRCESARYGTA